MNECKIEGLKDFHALGDLKSNKTDLLSFKMTSVDLTENDYRTNLFTLDLQGQLKQVTFWNKAGPYKWLSKESILLTVPTGEQNRTELQEINVKDGSTKEYLHTNQTICDFQIISEEKILLLCEEKPEAGEECVILEEAPFWQDGTGICSGSRYVLYLYERGRMVRCSEQDLNVDGFICYRDEYVVFFGTENKSFRSTKGKLYYFDLISHRAKVLDESNQYIYTKVEAVSSNHILAARNDLKLHGEYQDEYMDLIALADGSFRRLNSNCDYHLRDSIVSDITYGYDGKMKFCCHGEHVYFLATVGTSSHIMKGNFTTEQVKQITTCEGKVTDFVTIGNEIYFIGMREMSGQEVYRIGKAGGQETRMTHIQTSITVQMPKKIRCNSNSVSIDGFLIEPADRIPGQRYPAILFIHGGPNLAYGISYVHELQVMASSGFAVVYCNPRGSVGKGGRFADIRKRYGCEDCDDILAFLDYAVEQNPWIDTERLAVTGGSYGGIMTNWIVGHNQRFKAAIADRSLSNNISDFGMSDIGFSCGIDTNGVTPWENVEFLWETSPLRYADKIKTPMLFIHGQEDYRCPVDHALQMHSALCWYGTPSRVAMFPGENHGLWKRGRPKARVKRLKEMLRWLEQYL